MTACDAQGAATYCACALGHVMQQYPDASKVPGSVAARGRRAVTHPQGFPDCTAQ